MNANAKKWVEALRSGKYEQTTGSLTTPSRDKFCCLGVACDLYAKEHGKPKFRNQGLLPKYTKEWLGLQTSDGFHDVGSYSVSLAEMNDEGSSFAEIADRIEAEPDGLFA